MIEDSSLKPVIWVGTSLKDLRAFPEPVQDHVGYALYVAQRGGKHRHTKPLTGFGGAGVVEVVKGETPQRDIEMIRRRLREAEQIARKKES